MHTHFRHSKATALVLCLISAGCLLALTGDRTRGLLVHSFWLASFTALATVPPGLLLATLLVKFDYPGRRLAWILLISSLFLPLCLVAAAWQSVIGIQGWLAPWLPQAWTTTPSWHAAIFTHSAALLPVVTLIIGVGLASVQRELEEDQLLQAPPLAVLLRVTWRRASLAVLGAIVWVFVVCLGEMTVTDLFQIRTFAEEVYTQTAGVAAWDFAGAAGGQSSAADRAQISYLLATLFIAVVMLPSIVLCVGLVPRWHLTGLRPRWSMQLRHRRLAWVLTTGTLLPMGTLVGVPMGSLIYQAGVVVRQSDEVFTATWSWYAALAMIGNSPVQHGRELIHTALISSCAATAATVISALCGVWAASRRSGRATAALLAVVLITVPGPLLGLWIIQLLNQPPDSRLAFLALLYHEANFGFAPWLAQTLRVLPFCLLVTVPPMCATPRGLLESAALDGIGTVGRVFHVFLPLHWRHLILAWLVGFVLAIGELSATVLVAPPGITPLSVHILNLVHYGVDDELAGLVLFLWIIVLTLTCGICVFFGRGRRARKV